MTDVPVNCGCRQAGACRHRHEKAWRDTAPLAVLASVLLLAPLLVAHLLSPSIADQPGGCPLLQATGVPCPACGATRAFVLLAHGDGDGALRFNWTWIVIWAVVVIALAVATWRSATGRRPAPAWLRGAGRWLQGHPVAVVALPFVILAGPWAVAIANLGAIR